MMRSKSGVHEMMIMKKDHREQIMLLACLHRTSIVVVQNTNATYKINTLDLDPGVYPTPPR